MFAAVTAIPLVINIISIQYCIDQNFDLFQANFDGFLVAACLNFMLFCHQHYVTNFPYRAYDLGLASLYIICEIAGSLCLSHAMIYG